MQSASFVLVVIELKVLARGRIDYDTFTQVLQDKSCLRKADVIVVAGCLAAYVRGGQPIAKGFFETEHGVCSMMKIAHEDFEYT
ncbi:hypothetical protein ANCCEY_02872 [Ancylostoma ceylanicum]|uniref:Uncharacterized protein n=1 Tax=Ancylostoma ceylanicum TaxID=53326 RepID=A0A0D6M3E6_9BILA|nr:hypothetical protein ANCCEY_02872 [Ancylostoma ceylanicum]